jgi:hypothetical protein
MPLIRLNNQSISSVTALPSGVGGKVLQVLQVTSSTGINISSNSYTDILTLNFTPSATSSKVYLMVTCPTRKRDSATGDNSLGIRITKDGSNLVDFGRYIAWNNNQDPYAQETASMNYLDSPNTTSQLTYVMQFRSMNAGGVNVNHDDSFSSLTAMEIAG